MDVSTGFDYVRKDSRAVMLANRKNGAPAMPPVNVVVVDEQLIMSCRETAYNVGPTCSAEFSLAATGDGQSNPR